MTYSIARDGSARPEQSPILGVIVEAGPEGAASQPEPQSGAGYWVAIARCSNTDADSESIMTFEQLQRRLANGDYSDIDVVFATNLAEVDTDTHFLRVGQPVQLHHTQDRSTTGTTKWFFSLMPLIVILWLGGAFASAGSLTRYSVSEYKDGGFAAFPDDTDWTAEVLVYGVLYHDDEIYACGSFEITSTSYAVVKYDSGNGVWVGESGVGINTAYAIISFGGTIVVAGTPSSGQPVWRYNGGSWSAMSAVGGDIVGTVYALCVYKNRLYCGGGISDGNRKAIAVWASGTSWDAVGTGITQLDGTTAGTVYALEVYDDGNGDMLFIGGYFAKASGVEVSPPYSNIAKWDGSAYYNVGNGINVSGSDVQKGVRALCAYDDGSGRKLYAGGSEMSYTLVRWDGVLWTECKGVLGVITSDRRVYALADADQFLAVGGYFHTEIAAEGQPGAKRIASFNSGDSLWSEVGAGFDSEVRAILETGGTTFAAGTFTQSGADDTYRLAKLESGSWEPCGEFGDAVNAIVSAHGYVYAIGEFLTINETEAARIAKTDDDGDTWSSVGYIRGPVYDAEVIGSNIHMVGRFDGAGGTSALCHAIWNGSAWSSLLEDIDADDGNPTIYACAASGTDLYVCGNFNSLTPSSTSIAVAVENIAKIDTSTGGVSALAGGIDGPGAAIAVFDGQVWVGGSFSTVDGGGTSSSYAARYDISAGTWASMVGVATVSRACLCLDVANDGSGDDLYIGHYDGSIYKVTQWDGTTATVLGGSTNGEFDDAILTVAYANSLIMAGGRFGGAGEVDATPTLMQMNIAKWTSDGFDDLRGGIGQHPSHGSGAANGACNAIDASQTEDGKPKLLIGGRYPSDSHVYTHGVARLTHRGWVYTQGGVRSTAGSSVTTGARAVVQMSRHASKWLVVGFFAQGVNRWIADDDASDYETYPDGGCGALVWDGKYWTTPDTVDLPGGGFPYSCCEHQGIPIVCGNGVYPYSYVETNADGSKWVLLGDDGTAPDGVPFTGELFYDCISYDGGLYVCGTWHDISPGSHHNGMYWTDSTDRWTWDDSSDLTTGKAFAIGNLDDSELYMGGVSSGSNDCVVYKTYHAEAWKSLPGTHTLFGEAFDLCYVNFGTLKGGDLKTRISNDSCTITLVTEAHNITTSDAADISWDGGSRQSCEVISVSGADVTFDRGIGDDYPLAGEVMTMDFSKDDDLRMVAVGELYIDYGLPTEVSCWAALYDETNGWQAIVESAGTGGSVEACYAIDNTVYIGGLFYEVGDSGAETPAQNFARWTFISGVEECELGGANGAIYFIGNQPTTGECLQVMPTDAYAISGASGGPFSPSSVDYAVKNLYDTAKTYTVASSQAWLDVSPSSGTLTAYQEIDVTVSTNATTATLGAGSYSATITFTNTSDSKTEAVRSIYLTVT